MDNSWLTHFEFGADVLLAPLDKSSTPADAAPITLTCQPVVRSHQQRVFLEAVERTVAKAAEQQQERESKANSNGNGYGGGLAQSLHVPESPASPLQSPAPNRSQFASSAS